MSSPYYDAKGITLYLGNCLEITEWLTADVLITDPPYGIAGGRLSKHEGGKRPVHADAGWDDLGVREAALEAWGHTRPRAVFGSPKHAHNAPKHRGVPLVWEKGNDPGMGDYRWPFGANYELIYLLGDGWAGKRRGSVIKDIHRKTRDAKLIGHPTPKPVPLMEFLIDHAPPGVITDPFGGAGATLIAAHNLGRKAVGVEMDERYCEITAQRIEELDESE